MSDELAIEANGLAKSYRDVRVLAGVDLRVPDGSVFALLGPNGAGKTTMVRILSTLTRADDGRARVAGFDVVRDRHEVRRRISLTGQFAALDAAQTGAENLRMMGRLSRLPRAAARQRADELLQQFDLTSAGRRRVGTYSGGMRRRLDLAASLVGRPSVIFLDEPSTGLDPQSRQTMWQVIEGLAASGVTVFLTTQYLEEADQLCDRVAIIDDGAIVAQGTPEQLKSQLGHDVVSMELDGADVDATTAAIGQLDGLERVVDGADTLALYLEDGPGSIAEIVRRLDGAQIRVGAISVARPSLDDVFLRATGRRLEGRDEREHERGARQEQTA